MDLPAHIGKYELEEFLGGGMSHVYRARDTVIGRTVAVKILTEQGCADQDVKARFLAEARMAGSLTHDNILGIYDFGEDDQKRPFMVMEFLRGEDLRSALRKGNTGDLGSKLKIGLQIAKALEYTHSQKIVHRDIKPENIHINAAGVVKLIDFGIAKTEGLQMTRAGYVLGTPFYMAPEQVMGEAITEQVDVYAFGVLLFELFAGVKPIQAEAVERIFYFILNEPLNLEPLRQSGAPQAIIDLVERCTAKKPDARPAGFAPVVAALQRAMESKDEATLVLPTMPSLAPVSGMAPVETPSAKRPAWMLPAVLVVVLGLAAGLYFATRTNLPPLLPDASGDMVLIPAGPFQFGEKKVPTKLDYAYYIDKTEVTNQAYRDFCKATGCTPPDGPLDLPVVNVTIQEARAFAQWAKKRLPKAKEWEKAARGTSMSMFPWGDLNDPSHANVCRLATGCRDVAGGLQPVGAHPEGATPSGILQMVGNAWEWIDEPTSPSSDPNTVASFQKAIQPPPRPDEYWYPTRGLSFRWKLADSALWEAGSAPARARQPDIGFRCVKDVQ